MIKLSGSVVEKKGIYRVNDQRIAMDSQILTSEELYALDTALITTANNGVPAMFTTYLDSKVVEVLQAPLTAAKIYGEVQKGDWTTKTDVFMAVEYTGTTAPYGDFSGEGMSGHNTMFPQRQNYLYQINTVWGDLEVATAGTAKMNFVQLQQTASAMALMRRANEIYMNGVSGLQNYGILNAPDLIAATTPTTGTAGNTWANKVYAERFADFEKLYGLLVSQTAGLVTADTPMICALPPACDALLNTQNTFGQVLRDRIKASYTGISFISVPEFATGSGNLMQLIVPSFDGLPTGEVAFSEKMRAHGVVRKASSYEEKKTSGAYGFILYRPAFVAQILGI